MLTYSIIIFIVFFIVRLITYKPNPRSDSVKRHDSQSKLNEDIGLVSETDLTVYPYGPFYMIWQYKEYNLNAGFNNSPYLWEEQNFRIKDANNSYILTGKGGKHYGFVNKFMTNVLAGKNYRKIVLFAPSHTKGLCMNFTFVDFDRLQPIPNFTENNPPDENLSWYFTPEAVTDFQIEIKATTVPYIIEIPEAVSRYFPEILLTVDISSIYGDGAPHSTSCLVVLNLTDKTATVYPQDWFNKQQLDFGYQWIMRAKRLPESGRVSVYAMRTGHFILDDTYRNTITKK